jgi:hypothetical protein
LLVPPLAARYLVIDYGDLQTAILNVRDNENFLWKNPREVEAQKNRDLDRVVTLWIGPYETAQETLNAFVKFNSELMGRRYGEPTVKDEFVFRTVNFRTSLYENKIAQGNFQVISLTYPNYRHARSAYKKLLPLAAERQKVHCFAGANWDRKKKDPV